MRAWCALHGSGIGPRIAANLEAKSSMGLRVILVTLVLWSFGRARAAEVDALAISKNIQNRHFPHYTVLDPIFDGPTGDRIVSYTRCGDSALWTGFYLAAESFRYKVTRSADALAAAQRALA